MFPYRRVSMKIISLVFKIHYDLKVARILFIATRP